MDKKRTIKTQKTILFLGLKCNSTLEKSEIHTVQLIFVSLGQPVEKIMKILAIFILLSLTAIIPECIIRLSSKRRGRYLKNYLSKFANILYVVTKLQMGAQLQYLRTFFFSNSNSFHDALQRKCLHFFEKITKFDYFPKFIWQNIKNISYIL